MPGAGTAGQRGEGIALVLSGHTVETWESGGSR